MGRIARRGPKAIPLVDKERTEKFQHLTAGSAVEVSRHEPGFEGAWFRAKILRSNSGFNSNFSVQYQNLVSDDDPSKLLTENIGASFIRPVPPPPAAAQTYEKDDVVDAFRRDGWWKGVVAGIDGLKGKSKSRRKYTVIFEDPDEHLKFSSLDMRFHWVWIHGKWVQHPKHKEVQDYREVRSCANKSRKNPFEQSTPFSSTPICKKQKVSAPETEELMPGCSDGFRMEASTDFGSPIESRSTSLLGNSVEHIKDSALTKRSLFDTRENLQMDASNSLNKGKTSALASRKQCEEQSAHVPNKVSSTIDNCGEMRTNPLEKPISFSSASATKKQKMPTPETIVVEGTRDTKAQENPLSGGPISPIKGKNSYPNQQEARVENEMSESLEKRATKLNADVTNEHPADVINEECVEKFSESSAANVQSKSELLRDEDLPFRKSSYLWKDFDSLEVFKVLPQRPHFSPLLDCHDETREGIALGHMWTFISMVEKVSRLKIEDPRSLFDSYLEALDILELIGFDVKTVADRANELLSLKTNYERVKLEQEISEIDKKMRELEEQRARKVLEKEREYSVRDSLHRDDSNLKANMLTLEHEFKVKAGAPW